MRKYLVLITTSLLLISLGGCINNKGDESIMVNIPIYETEKYIIPWDSIQFPLNPTMTNLIAKFEPIRTNEYAKYVGETIIEIWHQSGFCSDYVLVSILHSIEDNYWRFEYSLNQYDAKDLIDCGVIYVVINGNDGSTITAWAEE